jgi:hypothetical protein
MPAGTDQESDESESRMVDLCREITWAWPQTTRLLHLMHPNVWNMCGFVINVFTCKDPSVLQRVGMLTHRFALTASIIALKLIWH